MSFLRRHRSKILTLLGLAAPVVAGVVSGGVFTVPVLISAAGAIMAKLAASPLNHDAERAADVSRRLGQIKNRGAL